MKSSPLFPKTGVCSLCGGRYEHGGNNPTPLGKFEERCCNTCNFTLVIPVRILRILRKTNASNSSAKPTA